MPKGYVLIVIFKKFTSYLPLLVMTANGFARQQAKYISIPVLVINNKYLATGTRNTLDNTSTLFSMA